MNNILKNNNIKSTFPREKILEIFQKNDQITIQDIKEQCPNVDISTIYRTIDLFIDKSLIIKLVYNNEIVYSLKTNHEHFLNCVKCHKRIKIESCPFEELEYDGFKILNHTILIEGICSKCQKNTKC